MAKRDYAQMATRLVVAAIGSKGRYKRVTIAAVAVVVLAGGAAALAMHGVAQAQAAALEGDWRALQACVLGGDALRDDETPASRLTGIQLAVLAMPQEARPKGAGDVPWPASCASIASSVSEHAAGAEQGSEELKTDASALAKVLRDDLTATADVHKEVDKVWSDAARAHLSSPPDPQAKVVAPKPAATRFGNKQFRDLPRALEADFALSAVHAEAGGGRDLRFLVDDRQVGPPVICETSAMRDMAECARVPAAVGKLPSPRLLATTEEHAMPLYFCGDRGQSGVFAPDGRQIAASLTVLGATSRADGSATMLAQDSLGGLSVIGAPATGPTTTQPAMAATDVDSPEDATIAWDWLVSRSSAKSFPPHHLMARNLKTPGPPVDVGELPAPPVVAKNAPRDRMLTSCRTEDAIVVRVRGLESDSIAFFGGGRWSAPHPLETRGGALSCRGHEAVVVAVTPNVDQGKNWATVATSRCDLSGCTQTRVDFRELLSGAPAIAPDDAGKAVAMDVDGKLAIAWSAGALGGLRLRVAPIDRIKTTADVVVFDGRDESGASPLGIVTEMTAMPAGTYGALFVNTTAGARVLRVDGDGKITALHVTVKR